jgi:hypothetical protein
MRDLSGATHVLNPDTSSGIGHEPCLGAVSAW